MVFVAVSAVRGSLWLAIALFVLAAATMLVAARRYRDRIALEMYMVRALVRSHQGCPGDIDLSILTADVKAEAMPDGVTRIEAASWLDAVRALGFVTGRDRGFQLDRLRRMAAGRLAEVWGSAALPVDAQYRVLGLAAAASAARDALDQEEADLLDAFAAGVTAAWQHDGPPFECRFLAYQPEPWTPTDSLIVALLLFHGLSWNEQSKRAEAVIRHVLPDSIARFFLPGIVGFSDKVPDHLDRFRAAAELDSDLIAVDPVIAGSNCWIQNVPDGPVVACDLHLPLAMPNSLYEIDLRWPGKRLHGLVAAGLPVVLTGGNGHIAWGVTNLNADVLDLVPVAGQTIAPLDLVTEREEIQVRGGPGAVLEVRRVGGTPVSPRPLLGEDVILRWTGYDVRSCDLKFQRLARAVSVDESSAILDAASGIPLNVLVADETGRMMHVAAGLLPRRRADSPAVVDGYLSAAERPRLVDPPDGVLVSANDAAWPQHQYRISYDPDAGHRARRVREMLMATPAADLATAHTLQQDTRAEVYVPYRDLAVAALGRGDRLGALLATWNGHADLESRAFGVLVQLRELLARRVLSPYLAACRAHDARFRYAFREIDRPVLAIIRSGEPALLPLDAEHHDWNSFVARCAQEAAAELTRVAGGDHPRWGEINRVGLRHPLEELAPWAHSLLGLAPREQPGALHCVRTCVPGFSAAGRAAIKPGPAGGAEFELPGGQSGHPLGRHYDDRHDQWCGTPASGSKPVERGCRFVLRATAPRRTYVTHVNAR